MAANSFTSITGSVAAKVFTFPISGHKGRVILVANWTKGNGTSIAISPVEILIPQYSTTVYATLPASLASGQTLAAYTLTISATGVFSIAIDDIPLEATKMKITVADTGGDTAVTQLDVYTDVL